MQTCPQAANASQRHRYSVGVRNSANGQELITGAAGLTIK